MKPVKWAVVSWLVLVGAAAAEPSLTELLEAGKRKVAVGKSATLEFQTAIGKDTLFPKFWALGNKADPLYAELCKEMAFAYQLERRLPDARDLIEVAVKARPEKISFLLRQGEIHWQMRNYKLALGAFNKVLAKKPDAAPAWHGKARCLQNMGETDEAVTAYEKALKLSPHNVTYLRDLGRLVYHQGDLRRSLKLYGKALQLNPEDSELHCEIGWIHYRSGKLQDALSVFLKETKRKDADSSCWFGLGTVMVRLGRLEEALKPLSKACELDPTATGYWRDLGNLFFRLKRYTQATAAYRNGLAIKSDNPVLWSHLGRSLEKSYKWQEALAAYQTAALQDEMGDAWGDQMHVLNVLKRYRDAIAVGEKALAIGFYDPKKDPKKLGLTNPRYVYRMLAEAYNGLKQSEKALEACDTAEKLSKKAGDGVYHLCYIQRGDAYLALGQFRKAKSAYKVALRGPEPDVARRRLQAIEDLVKDKDAAR